MLSSSATDIIKLLMTTFSLIYIFFEKYAIPFVFAVGLLYFLYGCIEYFIIGKSGDEERSQHGRELFLKSIAWFTLALLLFAAVAFVGWLGTFSFTAPTYSTPPQGGVNVNQGDRLLEVPNVPTR